MGKGLDRTQVVRIDCPECKGNGYVREKGGTTESMCMKCEGAGTLEKEIPYKFETNGRISSDEKAEIFDLPVEQVSDGGHSIGD